MISVDKSFRPRPIEINKQIEIFIKDIEGETFTSARSVPTMTSGMEADEEQETHLKQVLTQLKKEENFVYIPTPNIRLVDKYEEENSATFELPQNYIRYQGEMEKIVYYDVDSEDEEFLKTLNSKNPKKTLSLNEFETIIDKFEREYSELGVIPNYVHLENIVQCKTNNLEAIYEYWSKRRKEGTICSNYTKVPDPDDPSPYVAFRPRIEEKLPKKKHRKNDIYSFLKMKQLRQEMERARTVLEMIKKREKLKKDSLEISYEIFEIQSLDVNAPTTPFVSFTNYTAIFSSQYFEIPSQRIHEESSSSFLPLKRKKRKSEEHSLLLAEDQKFELPEEESDSPFEFGSDEELIPSFPYLSIALKKSQILNTTYGITPIPIKETPKHSNLIQINGSPPFRAKTRIGRGGRVIIERVPSSEEKDPTIEHPERVLEDQRLTSLREYYESGFHPLFTGRTSADRLLKKLEHSNSKKKKNGIKKKHNLEIDYPET